MQNNFVGPTTPQNHHSFVGPPYPEKNIIVNYGQPRNGSSNNTNGGGRGGFDGLSGGDGITGFTPWRPDYAKQRSEARAALYKRVFGNAAHFKSHIDATQNASFYYISGKIDTEILDEKRWIQPWPVKSPSEKIADELRIVRKLISQYTDKRNNARSKSTELQWGDLLSKSSYDLEAKIKTETAEKPDSVVESLVKRWENSYKSAHELKAHNEALRVLADKERQLNNEKRDAERAEQNAAHSARLLAKRQADEAARQLAQQQAEAVARLLAQQQAEATARQLAQQQAEATARQLAQQQAETAARQLAQLQAEEAARQLAQQQAETAARLLAQQQADEAARKLEVKTNAEARAQAAIATVIAAPSITPTTAVASKALEAAVNLAKLQFMASSNRALVLILAATYSPELGNSELRPASSGTPTAPPGIDALGPTTLPAASPFPSSYPGGKAVPNPTQNETLPGVDPADANASIPGFPADMELPSPDGILNYRPGDLRYHPKPKSLPAFPDAVERRGKTSIQGGGGLRPRWVDQGGNIYEWDSRHGAVEKYTKRGRHLGEFNPVTGFQTKPADPTRKIEP